MKTLSHIEQAKHNEKACTFISSKSQFSDWVVTTAFYSSIHYLRHLIIPHSVGSITYNTFDSLFSATKSDAEGRHGFQKRLVTDLHNEIGFEYTRLHDMSNNARYSNYAYTKEDSTLARKYLEQIRIYTLNIKPG